MEPPSENGGKLRLQLKGVMKPGKEQGLKLYD